MSLTLVQPPFPGASHDSTFAWAQCDATRTQISAQGSAAAALLPGSGELTLVVPSAALSWHTVILPRGTLSNGTKLRSVLNGLLEERLLDDPEILHFAIEPQAREGEPIWVASCDRAWLSEAIGSLESIGRRVGRLLPAYVPMSSDAAPAFHITGQPESPLLTRCDASGVLTLPLSPQGLELLQPALPEGASLDAEPAVAQIAEQLLEGVVPLKSAGERWLDAMPSGWDLAQFDFARTGSARARKTLTAWTHLLLFSPQWRAARWGAALLVTVQLVGINVWAWMDRQSLQDKRQSINAVLKNNFPHVQLVMDAPLQMQREVASLQQATGGLTPADLEPMLAALASVLPSGRLPTSIDYNNGQLRLRGLGLSVSELEDLNAPLASRGYSARSEADLLLLQSNSDLPRP